MIEEGKNQINFGSINQNDQQNGNNFIENENLISKINKENDNKKTEDINIENIKIDKVKKNVQQQNYFKNIETGQEKEKKHYHINYRKIFVLSFSTILITSLVSIGLYLYKNYLTNYGIATENQESLIINNIKKIRDFLSTELLQKDLTTNNIELIGANGIENLNKTIDSNSNYIQKKETIKNGVEKLANIILTNHKVLNDTKKNITKNGFFSQEISNIISEKEQIASIQNSLISLESIKFSSAINVFTYLDTFLQGLSSDTKIKKSEIEEKTKIISERGEKDINLYIKNCYLNPFEIDYDCKMIGDFDKYYLLTKDDDFDRDFLKKLIKYSDIKLEQTELPSFSINFEKFDKNSNKITFNININTFKQDELELAKKGILSPHIFILNNLINNLKQSRFILGNGISVKSLNTISKTIKIGTTEFVVNNSNKSFTVDIQKESEREINDFIDIK